MVSCQKLMNAMDYGEGATSLYVLWDAGGRRREVGQSGRGWNMKGIGEI